MAGLCVMLAGCSVLGRSRPPADAEGRETLETLPLRLDAVASQRGDTLGVEVVAVLPAGALALTAAGSERRGAVEWTLQTTEGLEVRVEATEPVGVDAAGGSASVARIWWVPTPPGEVRFLVTAVDPSSGRRASGTVSARIPDPSLEAGLGRVRLARLAPGGTRLPVDATAVPAASDSVVALTLLVGLSGREVTMSLDHEQPDPTLPTPPFAEPSVPDPPTSRRVTDASTLPASGAERWMVGLPALEPGLYRVRLTAADSLAPGTETERYVVVRRRDYPRTPRLGDLLGPLRYLADPAEGAALASVRAPSAQRRVFDRFWGRSMSDRRLAAATVRAYYERVEEANRRYAHVAEGWATDRGMIHIVFGPPDRVQRTPDGETWEYAGGRVPPFTFRRTDGPYSDDIGPTYVLQRDPAYATVWGRAQRAWRTGRIP